MSEAKKPKLNEDSPSDENSFANVEKPKPLSWEDFFMGIAFLASMRSKDPNRQVGACVVNSDREIIGVGYNAMPYKKNGENDAAFTWRKNKRNPKDCKLTYVCHAELNAIINKHGTSVKGCTLYTTWFPCKQCAKLIVQSGIREVRYWREKLTETFHSRKMFDNTSIKYEQHNLEQQKIVKEFVYTNWENFFMNVAFLASKMCKGSNNKVGACIVNSNKNIIGVGYHSMPHMENGSDDGEFSWDNDYICHAELNAIISKPASASVNGCTLYVTSFPCNECAKLIIQSGIKEVKYLLDDNHTETECSKLMFDKTNVEHTKYTLTTNVYNL